MAEDFHGLALEKAEFLSSRLKEVLSSGQEYIRAQFGVDLGLKPEFYPTWVILFTAAVGLLLLVGVSWAAVCGGLLLGKKRGSPVTQNSCEPDKAISPKTTKPEEQKKRNKKKTSEKKTQLNLAVAQEVKVTEAVSKVAPQIKTEKVNEVPAPVQVKKSKKKNKTDVKPVQHIVTTNYGKETDDGAWETKVSNREKKRRKDKGSEDSGSPKWLEVPKSNAEAPVAPASTNTKKNKGNHVSSGRREEPSVNGGDWSDVSPKLPGKMGALEAAKWRTINTPTHYRAPPKHQPWAQETKAWSGIDGQIKSDLSSGSFSMLGRHTTEPVSNSVELQWVNQPGVEDEWSGFNGVTAVDSCSDWNAPAEHWGNYEEVFVTPAPPPKEQPVPNKGSEDEKDTEDPSGGEAKSKRKRKKKKMEEEGASEAQMVNLAPQELPAPTSKKLNPSISSSHKKPEKIVEPPKTSQKRKVRRET